LSYLLFWLLRGLENRLRVWALNVYYSNLFFIIIKYFRINSLLISNPMDFFTKARNYLYIFSFKTLNFYTTTIIVLVGQGITLQDKLFIFIICDFNQTTQFDHTG